MVVPLSEEIALSAAEIGLKYTLPMADAIVYATALRAKCLIVTSDPHFKGLEGVIHLDV